MFSKLMKTISGKDDLERIAWRENLDELNECLKTRRVWIPRRPKRFLNAADFTTEQLMELIESEAKEFADGPFEPWILEVDGLKRLPAFSSQKRMQSFSGKMSQSLNKVFSLGCGEVLLWEIVKDLDIDFVDLNLFSEKSWEIEVRNQSSMRAS